MSPTNRPSRGIAARAMWGSTFLAACGLSACGDASAPLPDPPKEAHAAPSSPASQRALFFGDLHVHSGWSIDAWGTGVRATPKDAYRYALGEAIDHPAGGQVQLQGPPLDFMAVTDHSEYLGVTLAQQQENHPLRRQPLIQAWLGPDPNQAHRAWARIRNTFNARVPLPALVRDEVLAPAWQSVVAAANQFYVPGEFTTLIGFEYSPNPDGQNLHRNVLFRGDDVPARPFSAMDSLDPEALWAWMDETRASGDDVLAIPHNANGSNGLMFARTKSRGQTIDAGWANQRRRNEPLAEVFQIKGQSETAPPLSPRDEWAAFAYIPWRTTDPSKPSQASGSYLRDALRTGLEIEAETGVNPYALGAVGSTDGHNATSPFEERNYTGKLGVTDGTPQTRLDAKSPNADGSPAPRRIPSVWGAAGIAGIWADRNDRAGLFDALRRRETFATTGPRIRVRLFAGWDFEQSDALGDFATQGYARGVAMGSELKQPPIAGNTAEERQANRSTWPAPRFLIAAQQDPSGARLERVQIVKGWLEGNTTHERVVDIACGDGSKPVPTPDSAAPRCPHAAPAPNPEKCIPTTQFAASEFSTFWRDPEYDPRTSSFYYARILEVPTCRWSTLDANRLGIAPRSDLDATIQERAVTSSIWIPAR